MKRMGGLGFEDYTKGSIEMHKLDEGGKAHWRPNKPGATYWVTGLPGAGKTSVGRLLWRQLQSSGRFALFLDGDDLRALLGGQAGYRRSERHALAKRYASLCLEFSSQGAEVVCATVSMFEDVRQWNRSNLPNYREIYLRVPIEILQQRDQKGLYSGAARGGSAHVPGVDQAFEEPSCPDVVIDNDGRLPPEAIADQLFRIWAPDGRMTAPDKASRSIDMTAEAT